MRWLKFFAGVLLAAGVVVGPFDPGAISGPVNPHDRRETLRGAYDRSLGFMEPFNRETNLQRENYGGRGRINDLRDRCREAEVPRNFQPGYLGAF